MKKFYILLLLIFCISLKVFAEHDDKFLKSLKSCTPYTSNGAIDAQGISADYNSSILGWDDNKCVYKKNVKMPNADACIECRFTKNQIKNLVDTMNAYTHLQEYYEEKLDFSDFDSIKNNPVVKIWSNYFNDPSTCTLNINSI